MAAEECSETFRDPRYRTDMSEREFGTFEASLMSATAVVLAAHGHNCGHSDRMAEFSRPIARELSLPDAKCEEVYMTGLLHDVGQIGVPDDVLKKPGRLTDAEF